MRNRILKMSSLYFARNGFGDTKISDLAKHIGIGQGTIYLYFFCLKSHPARFLPLEIFAQHIHALLESHEKSVMALVYRRVQIALKCFRIRKMESTKRFMRSASRYLPERERRGIVVYISGVLSDVALPDAVRCPKQLQ